MSKEYKVRLLAHAGQHRRRAGLYLEKGVPQVVELTDAQLKELNNDTYISVKPYEGEGEQSQSSSSSTTTPPKAPTRKELDARATELGLNPKEYKNIEQVTAAIEEAEKAAEENTGNDDEEEEVNLAEKSVDELELIAAELNLNVEKVEDEAAYKAALVKAIEDAKPADEE